MNKFLFGLAVVGLFGIVAPETSAHPGNTASDGCHYCRTNCAKWGEVENARHCHGSSSSAGRSSRANDDGGSGGWLWPIAGIAAGAGVVYFGGKNKSK